MVEAGSRFGRTVPLLEAAHLLTSFGQRGAGVSCIPGDGSTAPENMMYSDLSDLFVHGESLRITATDGKRFAGAVAG